MAQRPFQKGRQAGIQAVLGQDKQGRQAPGHVQKTEPFPGRRNIRHEVISAAMRTGPADRRGDKDSNRGNRFKTSRKKAAACG